MSSTQLLSGDIVMNGLRANPFLVLALLVSGGGGGGGGVPRLALMEGDGLIRG